MQTIQIRLTKELIKKAENLVHTGLYSNKSEVIRDSLRRLIFKNTIKTEKRNHKIIYTSDLHGNKKQYNKLFERALKDKTESIIIGGDITPKDKKHRTIEHQKHFIEEELIPSIKEFNKKNKLRSHKCNTYLMMGNDDFKANYKILKKYEKQKIFKLIDHKKCIKFHEDFKIIGYSHIPATPFKYKDWEKPDLNEENEYKDKRDFIEEGIITKGNKIKKFKLNLKNRKKTIERDITNIMKKTNPRKTILVTHAPPFKTHLDMIENKRHVGSSAIKKIIEEKQPYLTMHGHIHETVKLSNNFKEINKKTISLTSGNDPLGNKLSIINLNLYEPKQAIRKFI